MSFSEKMRESLGATGVRLEITPPDGPLGPGATLEAKVELRGGTTSAHVDALVLRLIEADRHWSDAEGTRLEESEVTDIEDRSHLTAGWDRRTVAESRISFDGDIEASGAATVEVALDIPVECNPSSISCAHTLNVQADIKGQIDPTANARIVLRA